MLVGVSTVIMSAVWNRVCKRLFTVTLAKNVISPQVFIVLHTIGLFVLCNAVQAVIVRGFRPSSVLLLATEGEDRIAAILTTALQPTYLQVQDISGNQVSLCRCG